MGSFLGVVGQETQDLATPSGVNRSGWPWDNTHSFRTACSCFGGQAAIATRDDGRRRYDQSLGA
ncbi:MAG: hypothetical protein ACFBSG_01070, partial [Leptolyngbyaceae cyanobacterium]